MRCKRYHFLAPDGLSLIPFSIFECMMYIWDVHYCADKYPSQRTWKQRSVQVFNVIVLLLSIFAMVAGTYAAAVTIRDDVASNATSKPFSCDDNSG